MTSEEIEREVFWLVSHEENWHTAVTSSIEVVRGSAENPMVYEGQVCREPVHYSLDLHPLLDLATYSAQIELTPPSTAANYARHVPRRARPPNLQAWLLARQLQEWDIVQDARRLLRTVSVLVCGSDEKWKLLGDMGVSRLRSSPRLLTYYDNHEALARLSWAHYAVGVSLSVELGCTINFVTLMDQEVGIATFAPLYDVVLEHLWECFPEHPSTIMRGHTIYIPTYHGCCYPVVNIPQT
jgi:hypothetical protein